MESSLVDQAIELLEKANADLQPELLSVPSARKLLGAYAKAERLCSFGVAALSRKLNDAGQIAKATGTSVGKAKAVVATGQVMGGSEDLQDALRHGDISLDQAATIASAEASAPGSAGELLRVAQEQSFQVLKDKARKAKLEAEQHNGLAARSARNYSDELGMVHLHLAFEPHVGTLIVNRAEAEAGRLFRAVKQAAKGNGAQELEPFERYLADAYAAMLSGSAVKPHATRPELVVLVSHEVAKRGWTDVRPGEVCKIPGVGPISPQIARDLAQDAFVTGVVYDGKDLRQMRRWTRNIPVEVRLALELGKPPGFDGVRCVDCGNRFRNERDHVEPHVAKGPASTDNIEPRCWPCHQAKTERDRRTGKLKPPDP